MFFFFFNDTATPEISPLSLPDALPICFRALADQHVGDLGRLLRRVAATDAGYRNNVSHAQVVQPPFPLFEEEDELVRSEEHTSELQSPCNLVCRLLLEKKNIVVSASTI